jgi:hypothetical protein
VTAPNCVIVKEKHQSFLADDDGMMPNEIAGQPTRRGETEQISFVNIINVELQDIQGVTSTPRQTDDGSRVIQLQLDN